jgi:hypothetical protein
VRLGAFERYGEVLRGAFIALVGFAFWIWPDVIILDRDLPEADRVVLSRTRPGLKKPPWRSMRRSAFPSVSACCSESFVRSHSLLQGQDQPMSSQHAPHEREGGLSKDETERVYLTARLTPLASTSSPQSEGAPLFESRNRRVSFLLNVDSAVGAV